MTEITKKDLKKQTEEIKRHNKVLLEDFDGKIKPIAEMVTQNTEDITIIKSDVGVIKEDVDVVKVDIGVIKEDVDVIKGDISLIKQDLKEKVGRDEFNFLEKRVIILEKKTSKV